MDVFLLSRLLSCLLDIITFRHLAPRPVPATSSLPSSRSASRTARIMERLTSGYTRTISLISNSLGSCSTPSRIQDVFEPRLKRGGCGSRPYPACGLKGRGSASAGSPRPFLSMRYGHLSRTVCSQRVPRPYSQAVSKRATRFSGGTSGRMLWTAARMKPPPGARTSMRRLTPSATSCGVP